MSNIPVTTSRGHQAAPPKVGTEAPSWKWLPPPVDERHLLEAGNKT